GAGLLRVAELRAAPRPGGPAPGAGDHGTAGVPRTGRAGLPDARPRGRHALGRRASAGAAGLADRGGGGGWGRRHRADPRRGLHPRDTDRLVASLRDVRDAGNSVLVVEHDEAVIRSADWVIDLGPGAGPDGGRVVAEGEPDSLDGPESSTARYLRGEARIEAA